MGTGRRKRQVAVVDYAGGVLMSNDRKIDYAKLFGFETVSDYLRGAIDSKDEPTSARRKSGEPEAVAPTEALDHSKLLGFAIVSDKLAAGLDFQNETISARLGSKIGIESSGDPEKG
jgi:hypothetical protein